MTIPSTPGGSQRALGLLIPAPNIVLEQDFARWMPRGGRLHVNRLFATSKRPADMRENLADLTASVGECARLLGMARPDVIAFGCTSGSFFRGAQWEASTTADIAQHAGTHAVVLTAVAVVDALKAVGARRIAVASPYPEQVNALMLAYLESKGLQVVGLRSLDAWAGVGIPNLGPDEIEALVMSTPYQEADAVFVSCTNLRAGEMIDRLEAKVGKPVVSSNQATFWSCARALGIEAMPHTLGCLRNA